jgi:hypothetical protein
VKLSCVMLSRQFEACQEQFAGLSILQFHSRRSTWTVYDKEAQAIEGGAVEKELKKKKKKKKMVEQRRGRSGAPYYAYANAAAGPCTHLA